jgi:hypothetical protein
MKAAIRRIGNSRVATAVADALVWPDFANEGDADLAA